MGRKINYGIAVPLLLLIALNTANAQISGGKTLQIKLHNEQELEGSVHIAIYDKEEHYLSSDAVAVINCKALSEKEQIVKVKLPFGQYAICYYNDKNENGILDKGIFNIPTEPYGFSNNVTGSFGPPSFEKTVFDFRTENQLLIINSR